MIYSTLAAIADYRDNNNNFRRNRFDNSAQLADDQAVIAERNVAGALTVASGTITHKGKTITDPTAAITAQMMDGILKRTPLAIVQKDLGIA